MDEFFDSKSDDDAFTEDLLALGVMKDGEVRFSKILTVESLESFS